MLFYQSLPVAFGNEAAKWICVGAIDITQLSVAGMFILTILLALFAYCFHYSVLDLAWCVFFFLNLLQSVLNTFISQLSLFTVICIYLLQVTF